MERIRRRADREDLGVRGSVLQAFDLVVAPANHDAFVDDHAPHRDLVGGLRGARLAERGAHALLVVPDHHRQAMIPQGLVPDAG